jgi:hypothetical protein
VCYSIATAIIMELDEIQITIQPVLGRTDKEKSKIQRVI